MRLLYLLLWNTHFTIIMQSSLLCGNIHKTPHSERLEKQFYYLRMVASKTTLTYVCHVRYHRSKYLIIFSKDDAQLEIDSISDYYATFENDSYLETHTYMV